MHKEVPEQPSLRKGQPAFTINGETGRLYLNAAAGRAFEGAWIAAIEFWKDKRRHVLAISALRIGEAKTYGLIANPIHGAASLTIRGFLRKVGWSGADRVSIPAKWDKDRCALIAVLPAGRIVVKGISSRRPESAKPQIR